MCFCRDGHGDWPMSIRCILRARAAARRAASWLRCLAEPGTQVKKGAPLLILEAMKMEHTISAPSDGLLKAYRFAVGDQVNDGVDLVEFEPAQV